MHSGLELGMFSMSVFRSVKSAIGHQNVDRCEIG